MDYETLQKANSAIDPIDIRGKKYAQVNQRIKAFRMCYPEGAIKTELIEDKDGRCVIKATVYADYPDRIIGTGTAYEVESSSNINRGSYIENCETSAVGRALGMCGFGIDFAVSSADELSRKQESSESDMYKTELCKYAPKCSDCGLPILPLVRTDGNIWTIDEIITYTEGIKADDGKIIKSGRFGRALCGPCQKKSFKAEREAQKRPVNEKPD